MFQTSGLDDRYNTFSGSQAQQRRPPTYLILASKIVRPRSTYQVIKRNLELVLVGRDAFRTANERPVRIQYNVLFGISFNLKPN